MDQGDFPACGVARPEDDRAGAIARLHLSPWRLLCLAQVANFAGARRVLGRARADQLADDVMTRAEQALPDATLTIADRRTAEIEIACADRDEAQRQVALLVRCFAQPFLLDGELHQLNIAIGAALGRFAERGDLRLLEQAEASLAEARPNRPVAVRDMEAGGSPIELGLASDLPGAIAGGQMRLAYQPKVHLRRQEVASVEALIRWQHPVHGLVPPNSFIPIAEDARLVDALTLWVIRQVIEDQRELRRRGFDPTIFINVSGQLLSDCAFVAQASALVRGSDVRIGFEVTETSVIRDPESAIANLTTFAKAGITIAIDDYGAGLSSLAYLKQLPARELKIDKLFVTQLASSNRDPLIVRSTIDLAHALEMEVVAEGVETPAALALLTVMGCDMAQGFLISRPVPLGELIDFLEAERFRDLAPSHRFALARPTAGAARTSR